VSPAQAHAVAHPSPAERAAAGLAARKRVPRTRHGEWDPPSNRPDPVALLEAQSASRVPDLIPIRYGRMLVSPFAFYRGGAAIMASDLSHTPTTDLLVQLCGDAHLSNFGGFASPERELVFDINDFDETLPGPFEWDLKRLAASVVVAARDLGHSKKQRRTAVLGAVAEYRETMREFAKRRNLDAWYAHMLASDIERKWRAEVHRKQVRNLEREIAKARAKDSMRAFAKLTRVVDGERRIISDPPLIVPIQELMGDGQWQTLVEAFRGLLRRYRRTLPRDRRHLLETFRAVDVARKVVGVGSVGTRSWIVLLLGRDGDDPLFLQAKEADQSVLARFLGKSEFANQGQRVVEGQRLLQAAGDIFLGWDRIDKGMDGKARDFYVRQLWDWKVSADIESMTKTALAVYAQACGWTLSRAHARSGDRIALAEYMGESGSLDEAIADFAESYADQNERDFAAFSTAVESGRLKAERGL